MAQSIRLDDNFVNTAKVYAAAASRSVPKQIEYMALIGQIAIDNPDLSYAFINEALHAQVEMEHGLVKPYKRRTSPSAD